ncbi:MAG: protein kinase, partial [Gemmatimonadota bacterium]
RFLAEIRTTANLQHPHILPLFDSGAADGFLFYVMPLVEGISLRDRMNREKQLPVEEAVRIAREVASALDYAHRHGVIHRDIKPENILLHDGQALVADFGIALAASKAGSRMTETGMSLGTPHYMSPEQAMGEREITARSDVYALGCVTYEMLVGEPPFTGPTAQAIVARVMTEEPRHLMVQRRSVPPGLEAAVLKSLEKLPADRFATAAQFAEALTATGGTVATHVAADARANGGRIWRRRFQVACAVAVLAAGLAAWGWARARAGRTGGGDQLYFSLGDAVSVTTGGLPMMALSADGSSLAFIGDSASRIWVKRWSALNPVPLGGTEGATAPVFSPDGQWIAYVAGAQLRKVRPEGGASVTIADSAAGDGIAWLDDNTLVYPSPSLLSLRRVSAAGGPVTVLIPDSLLKGLGVQTPTALPGARGVLFQVCTSGCATLSLHVLDLKTGREKLLLNDVAMGWYLPTGQLLYVRRDGVGLVADFDLKTLSIRGAAVPVLQNVARTRAAAHLAVSQTGVLVYAVGDAVNGFTTPVRVGRDGIGAPIDSTLAGEFNSMAISPDGRRLAIGVRTPGAELNIWVKQLDHGPFTRLTFSGRDRRPAWSPDGREVAFVRDSGSGGDIYARKVDGGGTDRRLVHLDRAIQEVAWSHDGQWLLLRTETAASGNGDILAVRANGEGTPVGVATSPFTELNPAMSPDGRWVAYSSNEAGNAEIVVRPFPNADAGRWQVSNGGGTSPVWSADGKHLYFLDAGGRVVSATIDATTSFNVPELVPMFNASRFAAGAYHQAFDVTRDGQFVFLGAPGRAATGSPSLVRIDNWFADVKQRAAQ